MTRLIRPGGLYPVRGPDIHRGISLSTASKRIHRDISLSGADSLICRDASLSTAR